MSGDCRAFELGRHVSYDGAAVTGAAPLVVRTPPEPWAYALAFLPEWPAGSDGIDGMIRVRIRVLSGAISLLSLSSDGARITDETIVPASGRTVEATLVAAPLTACERVVLRTAGTGGTASEAEVCSIDYIQLGDADRGGRLPPPNLDLKPVPDWGRYYGRGRLTVDERLRSARYAVLDRVKAMQWFDDLELLIRPNEELSRAVYVSGTYEPASLLAMKRLLPTGGVFVDVGANVGLYSMLASRWTGVGGQVFSFEPSEREFSHLREHVELNRLANVTTFQMAVADRDGTFELRVAEYPYAGHNTIAEKFVYASVVAKHTERVAGVTLDRFASETRLERVDLVKVDVEGGEQAVLAGATTLLHKWRPSWIFEVSAQAISEWGPPASLDPFYAADYRVFQLDAPNGAFSERYAGEPIPAGNLVAVPAERQLLLEG